MKKESLTTRKVVNLADEKYSRMTEDELLAHVIDQLVTQTSQLAMLITDVSNRLAVLEDRLGSLPPSSLRVPFLDEQ